VRVIVSNANGAGFTDAELRLVDKVDEVADAPLTAPAPLAQDEAVEVVEVVEEGEGEGAPRRGGRAARIVAGLAGLAAGAAALVAARRR